MNNFENNYNLNDPYDFFDALDDVVEMEPSEKQLQLLKQLTEVADKEHHANVRIYLRSIQCLTCIRLGQSLLLFTLVPEMMALEPETHIPENPDYPEFGDQSELVLWSFKWMLQTADDFYQISVAQFERYLEEYKKRCKKLQRSARSAYSIEGGYFRDIDWERAEKAFKNYRKEPIDDFCDCPACERALEVSIHLDLKEKEKADELAKDLWNKKLECENNYLVYRHYLNYYLKQNDYDHALEQCKIIESDTKENNDIHVAAANLINCYIHFDLGHAVSLWETYWMEGEQFKNGNDMLSCQNFAKAACKLWEAVNTTSPTIKLNLSPTFPLYSETGEYKVADLYEYYFNIEREIGSKFEERNRIYWECKTHKGD